MNVLELFAGAGGGILGSMLNGHRTVCAVEYDAYARSVLLARQNDGTFPTFPVWDDVCTFDGRPWRGIVDVVSGGFPCQDISVAGNGAGIDGEKSGLWKDQARIIREVNPRFAWMENSPAITVRGLGVVLRDLAEMGFDAEWGMLSCADAGGVHLRQRFWLLATNNRSKRREGIKQEQVFRFKRFPWGEDVRSLEELRGRSDLPEPLIRRIGHDVAFGLDRLKAIGNGQVPIVAATAWNILKDRI